VFFRLVFAENSQNFLMNLSKTHVASARAKDYRIKFSIGTDAHNKDHLRYMDLGVATASRGWLEKKDVTNTSSLKELRKLLET
jgi:DNA polymerase (family 10)